MLLIKRLYQILRANVNHYRYALCDRFKRQDIEPVIQIDRERFGTLAISGSIELLESASVTVEEIFGRE